VLRKISVNGVATRASIASSPPACAGAAVPPRIDGDGVVPAALGASVARGIALSERTMGFSFTGARDGTAVSRTTTSFGCAFEDVALDDVAFIGRGLAATFAGGSADAERTNTFVSLPLGGRSLVLVVVPGESLRTGAREESGSESTIGSPGRVCCATLSFSV